MVAIKNPGIFRYFWSVLGRLIAHVYTLNLALKLTGITKEGVQQKSLSFIAGLVIADTVRKTLSSTNRTIVCVGNTLKSFVQVRISQLTSVPFETSKSLQFIECV